LERWWLVVERLRSAAVQAAAALLCAFGIFEHVRLPTRVARLLRGMRMKTVALFFFSFVVACGGTVIDIDGGGTDSGNKDSGNETGCTDCFDAATFSCGKTFCNGSEICIHGCCGGAQICAPLEDGGTCPQGLSISQQCPPDSPCSNVCTPPEPYCGTQNECSMVQGHDCYLLCQ
jgi:hypothetical protein